MAAGNFPGRKSGGASSGVEADHGRQPRQTTKIGTDMDPVVYAEDDIFGYMRTERGQGRIPEEVDDEDEAGAEGAEIAGPRHDGARK